MSVLQRTRGAAERSAETSGIVLAAGAAVSFGTLAISGKWAQDLGADTVPLLSARFAIAALLLGAFMALAGRPLRLPRRDVAKPVLLGAVGYAFEATLFFKALEEAPAGTIALIFYTYPLWTSIIGFVSGLEPFRWRFVGALSLGMAGVSLIFTIKGTALLGPLLALGAAFAVAVYFSLAQVLAEGIDPAATAFWTATGAAASLGAIGWGTGQDLPADALVAAGALGLATAVAFVALFAAMARIGAARTSVAAMVEPVTTVVLAALFLGEAVTGRIAVGTVLIVAALPLLGTLGRRRPLPPEPDAL